MRTTFFPDNTDAPRFYLVLGSLVVAAWGFLVVLQNSPYAGLTGHESIGHDHLPFVWHLAAFLLSWALMTVAMMLPASLPALNRSAQPLRHQMNSSRLIGVLILGYLSPWILFGLLGFLGDSYLHQLFSPPSSLAAYSEWIAPSLVLVAGLYQLTPLKRRYIMRCQPSAGSLLVDRAMQSIGTAVLKQGLRLGVLCVGSCWSLMLLMFALGHHRLDWMLALGCVMAAERLTPWGRRLSWLVGLALIVWAAFWVLSPLLGGGHSHH